MKYWCFSIKLKRPAIHLKACFTFLFKNDLNYISNYFEVWIVFLKDGQHELSKAETKIEEGRAWKPSSSMTSGRILAKLKTSWLKTEMESQLVSECCIFFIWRYYSRQCLRCICFSILCRASGWWVSGWAAYSGPTHSQHVRSKSCKLRGHRATALPVSYSSMEVKMR